MPPIKELPEGVWTRIAAGEVVERPASAVKELVENALDAGAARVRVRLWDGGRLRIVVEDDGCGIALEDLPLALTPHATSKIRGIEDLDAIQTLGYRGEALASLTAVAGVEIRSRPESSASGGLIRAAGGAVVEHRPVNCAPGTRVQVDELFGNLPARRKFLKSAAGELRRAAVLLREYAACRPDVAFALEHDGREVLATRGHDEGEAGRRRVLEVLWGAGPDIQRAEAAAGHLSLECWWQPRQGGVKGMAARNDIMAFVNGRAVNDPLVKGAVGAAARELSGSWALFLSLDPSLVDVNIHPAKAEVRFRYPGEVFEAVRQAAAQLGGPASVPFAGGETAAEPRSRAAVLTRGWNFRDGPGENVLSRERAGGFVPRAHNRPFSGPPPAPCPRGEAYREASPFPLPRDVQAAQVPPTTQGCARSPSAIEPPEFQEMPAALPLPASDIEATGPAAGVPAYMGQTASGYLVFDAPDGLTLMDPHAAHERVGYERIRAQAWGVDASQNLLLPAALPPTLALEAAEQRGALEAAGFGLEERDGGLCLRSVPAFSIGIIEPDALLRASLAALKDEAGGDPRELLWRSWATMACKAAVKLTSALSREEALALWRSLHQCEQPFFCPHGRPTMLKMTAQDLGRHFRRE